MSWKTVIIDDDRNVLEGMRAAIPWEELEAEWVGESIDGRLGLELVLELQPDIVITDVNMPVMNGLEMIERLRKEQFAGKFIILSGYSDFEYARQALRLSVDDYLSKPATIQTLKAVMQRTVENLSQEQAKRMNDTDMRDKLLQYEPYVAKEWLKSLVTGTVRVDDTLTAEMQSLTAAWKGRNLAIGIELQKTAVLEGWKMKDWSLLRFAMSNVIQEVAKPAWPSFHYIELHRHSSVLLLHLQDDSSTDRELLQLAEETTERIASCINTYLHLQVVLAVGTIVPHWRQAADSFEAAFKRLSDAKDRRLGSRTGGQEPPIRSMRFYHQLAEALRNFRETQADETVAVFLKQIEHRRGIDSGELLGFGRELWAVLSYSMHDVGVELEDPMPPFDTTVVSGDDYTPAMLGEWLRKVIRHIVGSRQWNENIRHKQAVDFMIQYVHEHYADNITIGDLADRVLVSRNYLGQIFRNVIGETFNQYVTRVRMEKAKAMILEGKLYIYEIAEKVGYTNIPYFSTLFKKYTGFNPTELLKK